MPALPKNPYRQILSRRFPEPFIAMLAFLLGVWLWGHYFGEKQGYEAGTDRLAVVKLDRDSRLAEAMAEDPVWLRQMVGVDPLSEVQKKGEAALRELAQENSLGPEGVQAYVTLIALREGRGLLDSLRQAGTNVGGADLPPTYESVIQRLESGEGTWIDRAIARVYASERGSSAELAAGLRSFDLGTTALRQRAIISRGIVWAVILIGTLFIPSAILRLAKLRKGWDRGYGKGWSASLGLVIFLSATLAWIGFLLAMRAGFSAVPGIPPGLALALEAGMGMLPALIAVGLLFRRGNHVVRVFGIDRAPSWVLALGLFALLGWANELLSPWLEGISSPNPTGGLSAGEEGGWGLAFALVSACLVAPVSEEILYRGVLFRSLANRFGVLTGAVLSSGAFALVHFYNLYGLASVAVFGFTCALAYAATRSLTTVFLLHLLYNAAVKLPEWFVYHAALPGN